MAGDGRRGVDLALSGQHDVAIVDVGLPGLDGYQAASRTRARPPSHRLPLIALTGYGGDGQRALALRSGFDAHVVKPASPEVPLETVERVVAGAPGALITSSAGSRS